MSYFQFHFPCLDGMATLRFCHAYARGTADETQRAVMLRNGMKDGITGDVMVKISAWA